jgi:hypothetical protein
MECGTVDICQKQGPADPAAIPASRESEERESDASGVRRSGGAEQRHRAAVPAGRTPAAAEAAGSGRTAH